MMFDISRRRFLFTSSAAAVVAATGPAHAVTPLSSSLRPVARGEDLRLRSLPSIEDLIARAKLDGTVGFSVIDTGSDTLLEGHGAETGMPPASVAKALTASYALEALGPGHHFSTVVLTTGPVEEGTVKGDIVLVGGGDPTLDTDGLASLVSDLAKAGVRKVSGRFLVCGDALPYSAAIDPEQPEHVGYNPAVSGLNLNYNRVHFEWKKGGKDYSVSMDARSDTLRPAVEMAHMAVIARSLPVYTYADSNGRDEWTVARNALGNGGSRWLPVRKPELYAGEVFRALSAGKGVVLPAPEVTPTSPGGTVVASRESAPLRIILRDMLKWSTNLTAEVVGMSATRKRKGAVVSIRSSAEEMSAWARETLGLTHVALIDHSGLGDDSRIAAADMARALTDVRKRLGLKPLLKAIPVLDDNRRAVRNAGMSIHAKTGTLNFVSGLAGFVDLDDGRELAFAIFCGDLDRRAKLTRAERERPDGAASWNARAKALQQALIQRWGVLYAG